MLFFSESAIIDLEDIWLYTYRNWSKDQADRYYDLIINECNYISENFDSGTERDNILTGYRSTQVKSHLIFYKLNNDGNLEIIRILNKMMDLKHKF
ncbi:type II toxin-antitoxin system RelE/ParE family toxin [Pedobacter mucosus]|uniref:type II toxin-antitoxin system RelE/ParE family toxin n=1 Tax=Pedobacter mucosus TaxID=2895286 RepID=UPI00349EBCD6